MTCEICKSDPLTCEFCKKKLFDKFKEDIALALKNLAEAKEEPPKRHLELVKLSEK